MKKSILVLSCLSLVMVSCEKNNKEVVATETEEVVETGVADPAVVEVVDVDNAPVLALESAYDLGDVKANETVEKEIRLKNTGKTPLIIKEAKASCGCTVPEKPETPIAPGEEDVLKVAYTAPAVNGKQSKTVTLTTNTAEGQEVFTISANVVGGKEHPAPQPPAPARDLPTPNLN